MGVRLREGILGVELVVWWHGKVRHKRLYRKYEYAEVRAGW